MTGTVLVEGRSDIDISDQHGKGRVEEIRSTAHALHVTVGSGGQTHNRNINAASSTWASATNTATWLSPGVTDISITPLVTTTQGAVQNGQACLVVYDAPNDAVAAAWLADAGSSSTDVVYDLVMAGATLNRQFSSGISRIDVLPIGTGNSVMRVLVGAV